MYGNCVPIVYVYQQNLVGEQKCPETAKKLIVGIAMTTAPLAQKYTKFKAIAKYAV